MYLEAVVALHRKFRHVRAGAEVNFSIEVIGLQAQPPARTSGQHLATSGTRQNAAASPRSTPVTPGLRSLPPWSGREGWRKAGCAYLLRIRVPVIPQARVGQHEPMLLPLPADRGGKGKDRRETDRQLLGEAEEQGGTLCAMTSRPSLPPPPRPPQLPLAPLGWENLRACTQGEAPPPKASRCLSQQEQPQRARGKEIACSSSRGWGKRKTPALGLPLLARPGWTSIPS